MCVCVCVNKREKQKEAKRERERLLTHCVCVWTPAFIFEKSPTEKMKVLFWLTMQTKRSWRKYQFFINEFIDREVVRRVSRQQLKENGFCFEVENKDL